MTRYVRRGLIRTPLHFNTQMYVLHIYVCDQIMLEGVLYDYHSYMITTSTPRFHHHSIVTLMNNLCVCVWLPTAHQSAFPEAALWGMSDIHKCSNCL